MVWKHRGILEAFNDADDRIRTAAARSDLDLDEYRQRLDVAFNPVCEQIVSNPKNSDIADIQHLRVQDGSEWYVAYTEFLGWLMIYEVRGDTTFIRKIGQIHDDSIQDLLFGTP